MTTLQKGVRIDIVVTHQAEQRCAIASPVAGAQFTRLGFIHVQGFHHGSSHPQIDFAKNLVGSVVQGVI